MKFGIECVGWRRDMKEAKAEGVANDEARKARGRVGVFESVFDVEGSRSA